MEYDLEKLVLDILSKHKQLFQVGKERFNVGNHAMQRVVARNNTTGDINA